MRKILVTFCFLFLGFMSFSQNDDAKWTVAVSGSLVNFGDTGGATVGDQFLFQVPKISISKYLFHGLTIDVSSTISTLNEVEGFYSNNFNYFSIDGSIRYDFGTSKENLVPYIGLGIGSIGAPETVNGSKTTATTNFLIGATYWFSSNFGFTGEVVYKYSSGDFVSMRSHTQVSAGLVYSFRPRLLVQRIWNR